MAPLKTAKNAQQPYSDRLTGRPDIVAGCDWSARAKGRRTVVARRKGNGYEVAAPNAVGDLNDFPQRLSDRARFSVWLGVDAPLGLPDAFLASAGFSDFRAALQAFGHEPWAEFYEPTEHPTLTRPFYPAHRAPKGVHRRSVWFDGVSLGAEAFWRRYDRYLGAASQFWLIGPNQVGKGMIVLWRDFLLPHIDDLVLWPFDGRLNHLLTAGGFTVAEVYPALGYRLFELPIAKAGARKGDRAARAACAALLKSVSAKVGATLSKQADTHLQEGFDSDDDFDAFVATLLMLAALAGVVSNRASGDRHLDSREGWVLGLDPLLIR